MPDQFFRAFLAALNAAEETPAVGLPAGLAALPEIHPRSVEIEQSSPERLASNVLRVMGKLRTA